MNSKNIKVPIIDLNKLSDLSSEETNGYLTLCAPLRLKIAYESAWLRLGIDFLYSSSAEDIRTFFTTVMKKEEPMIPVNGNLWLTPTTFCKESFIHFKRSDNSLFIFIHLLGIINAKWEIFDDISLYNKEYNLSSIICTS